MSGRVIPRSLPFFAVHSGFFQKSVYSVSYPSSKCFARIGLAPLCVLKDLLLVPIRLFPKETNKKGRAVSDSALNIRQNSYSIPDFLPFS